jgi:hypothetical protein
MSINAGDILNKLADREGVEVAFEALDASKQHLAPYLAALGLTYEGAMQRTFEDTIEGGVK